MPENILAHEGKKYLREITDVITGLRAQVDVYAVLVAFNVTCPATAHAIKKLLCAGLRGKGDKRTDLEGALAAVQRALELAAGGAILRAVEESNNSVQFSHP